MRGSICAYRSIVPALITTSILATALLAARPATADIMADASMTHNCPSLRTHNLGFRWGCGGMILGQTNDFVTSSAALDYALDGDPDTLFGYRRLQAETGIRPQAVIDLGAVYDVTGLTLRTLFGRDPTLEVSSDGSDWSQAWSQSGVVWALPTFGAPLTLIETPTTARYLRLTIGEQDFDFAMSIFIAYFGDFNIQATPSTPAPLLAMSHSGTIDLGPVLVKHGKALPVTLSNTTGGEGSTLGDIDVAVSGGGNGLRAASGVVQDASLTTDSHEVTVAFDPVRAEGASLTLAVSSDGGSGDITVTGEGVAPQLGALGVERIGLGFGTASADAVAGVDSDGDRQTIRVSGRRGAVTRFTIEVENLGDGQRAGDLNGDGAITQDERTEAALRYRFDADFAGTPFRGATGATHALDDESLSGLAHVFEFRSRANGTFETEFALLTENGDPDGTNDAWRRDITLIGETVAGFGGVLPLGGLGWGADGLACNFAIRLTAVEEALGCGALGGSDSALIGSDAAEDRMRLLSYSITGPDAAFFSLSGFDGGIVSAEGLGDAVTLNFDLAAATAHWSATGQTEGVLDLFATLTVTACEVDALDACLPGEPLSFDYDILSSVDLSRVVSTPMAAALLLPGLLMLLRRQTMTN